jgi:hypothetical protein
VISTRRPFVALASALVAVTALGACSSTPSNKRVVEDIIESLEGVSEAERDCMLERVDRYTDDQLDDIADANEDFELLPTGEVANPTPALADFQADLASCLDGAATGSEPQGTAVADSGVADTDVADIDVADTDAADTGAPGSTTPETTLG